MIQDGARIITVEENQAKKWEVFETWDREGDREGVIDEEEVCKR